MTNSDPWAWLHQIRWSIIAQIYTMIAVTGESVRMPTKLTTTNTVNKLT